MNMHLHPFNPNEIISLFVQVDVGPVPSHNHFNTFSLPPPQLSHIPMSPCACSLPVCLHSQTQLEREWLRDPGILMAAKTSI